MKNIFVLLMKNIFVLLLISLVAIIAAPAYGDSIVGDTIGFDWRFPTESDILWTKTFVAPKTFADPYGLISVGIGDGVITVDNSSTLGWTRSSGFNGFILTDLTKVPNFTSFDLVSITGFPPPVGPILSFNSDQLIVNFNANSTNNTGSGLGQVYTFSFTAGATTVPEPGILILLGISMGSVVGLRRWWKD
jgi:hypothetical protein